MIILPMMMLLYIIVIDKILQYKCLKQWRRDGNHEMDGFEIRRIGNKETTLKILLYLSSNPNKFRVIFPFTPS